MHPSSTKQQFIELRAQGLSLSRIADQLGVSKRTLVDWNRERHADIASLRALDLEALHEKLLASHEQELTRLTAYQRKIDDELANRPLETLTTDKLLRLSLLVRREIRALCIQAVRNTCASQQLESQIKVDRAEAISPAPIAESPLHHIQPEGLPEISRGSGPAATPGVAAASNPHPERVPDRRASMRDSGVARSNAPSEPIPQPSTLIPQLSADPQASKEHCLYCGDPLPPLLPDGTRPSPWCSACGSPIAAPPGFSIRELCPVCAAPIPVHGYNINRCSGTCPECHTNLPNLDVNAPLKWLPPQHPLQLAKRDPERLVA